MSPNLPFTLHSAAAEVDTARRELGEASTHHRAALALLAAEIRETAKRLWRVSELTQDVADRMGLSPRTVKNALFETFRHDVMEVCLQSLAERITSTPVSLGVAA